MSSALPRVYQAHAPQRKSTRTVSRDEHSVRWKQTRSCLRYVGVEYQERFWPRISNALTRKFNAQVERLQRAGVINAAKARKLRTCGQLRPQGQDNRPWYCDSSWCPRCWRRRMLYLLRAIHTRVVEPELQRRLEHSSHNRRRWRLALGTIEQTVAADRLPPC